MSRIRSILVANRGEIALRVMRTAKALGYRTIAVYSTADADAPHVRVADDAVLLGPAPAAQSYLDGGRILRAAAQTGADAIHPGYGFLSENAGFARAVEAAGLVFIGPSAEAIDMMGNKAAAKRRMIAAGVPCVPGYEEEDQSAATLIAAAAAIGYPVMVKAAAGGGGRGMRLVLESGALPGALASARSEALNAFGSAELILEKAIECPRHVEFQVFADSHGNILHVGERDCSVQRRHQKVVEEAPCPVLDDALRARMGAAAVEAARSIDYRGAGTVEFLLDESGAFYFLEMNTRLQVEHPVTEMITGLDLVALQIRVAEGKALGITQEQVRFSGHAIEARLYAEDPSRDFLPVSGRVALWQPASGDGVRVDAGIASGQLISPFYDPMLAKIIAWGESRDMAIDRLVGALSASRLFGLATNKSFLVDILERETFRRGQASTAFIDQEFAGDIGDAAVPGREDAAIAALLEFLAGRDRARAATLGCPEELLDWSSQGTSFTHYRYAAQPPFDLRLVPSGGGRYRVLHGQDEMQLEVLSHSADTLSVLLDGRRESVGYFGEQPGIVHLARGRRTLVLRNELMFAGMAEESSAGGRVSAPMHGVLLEVFVKPGERVARGTRLAVLEAMKMQHELLSSVNGEVREVAATAGTQVTADDLLIDIEVDEAT
ncbi:MAG: acetyl-CoA carboxylase biotin carboxylase subunit [Gammaproteobacteria bacterium]|nr:acetyl-CoA carboxylase biotin carboxylase subunit [Gammaproteobacteria bacterium]MBK6583174.1 acetyl-CoA carboxylase biotin carboxylase subunit [Gammaproteobacteria bacterium]MBK7170637.1 acetyl-CoA carboxylase biotin carboxylase subunit [Gammaproteobacteria bacterium]MBK8305771.1 acetyl-CoA carboxylase biotin carboxylase subunit [Gammaproteobacteria bacterium]MBK9666193.1 acetyl-CoA carboxylase biotin carboxylase subunit [Gammaproteobacteria bacterium]